LATVNGVTQSYDAAGNLTSNGSTIWTYNARGRLVSAKLANATVYNYGINGLGQRVSKSGTAVSTGRQIYVYDEAGHLIGEYNNSGTRLWEHVYLGDLPVAVIASGGGVFPVLSDHLGTPRQVINASKQVRWKWDNTEPFGANAANQNPANLGVFAYNLRFPGQYFDAETGLHYNMFRDFNPQTGRYIESDPVGLDGGLNTYGYVGGNPVSRVDPNGKCPEEPDTKDGCPAAAPFGPYYRYELNFLHVIQAYTTGFLYGRTPKNGGNWPTVQAYRKPQFPDKPGKVAFCTPVPPAPGGGPIQSWYPSTPGVIPVDSETIKIPIIPFIEF
jgi:RHS repeat-associated protein